MAGDRKQDFLTITSETDSTAEAVVFKVKQNSAVGIAAKVNFCARKAHEMIRTSQPELAIVPATEIELPFTRTGEAPPELDVVAAAPMASSAGPSDTDTGEASRRTLIG